jgi:hypothetical protein
VWGALAYVSSGVTLIAFISAVIAWSYKLKSTERERLVRTTPKEQRASIVQDVLEFFHVDPSGLTQERQYQIAIEQIHARAKRFQIAAVVVCFLAVIAGGVTVYAIAQPIVAKPEPNLPENEARFDVNYGSSNFFKIGEKTRAEITLHANALTKNNKEAATIFIGMLVVHNEELFDINQNKKNLTCKETVSCISAKIYNRYNDEPLIIRGDTGVVSIVSSFDIPSSVRLIRLYWTFYQKEANKGNICVVDNNKKPPFEGIPFLKVVSKGGNEIKDICWRATGTKIVPVSL